jgi:hypothetical protein
MDSSSSPAVVLPNEFDASKLTYNPPRKLDNGGKVIYISYSGNKLLLQTPEMVAPFGMNKWDNDGKGPVKYSLDLSFQGKENREVLNKFYEGLQAMDKKLLHDGMVNSESWLNKKIKSLDAAEALYTEIVKKPKDAKYSPTVKVTLPHDGSSFTFPVYDAQRNKVDLSSIETKRARVSVIVQCVGIWVAGSKFGCSWKVIQMKITPPAALKGYAFREIADDKVIDNDVEEDEEEQAKDVIANADIEDEEDEEEVEESDDELDAKPAAVIKKKK